jgi:RHS repeat-associated protein
VRVDGYGPVKGYQAPSLAPGVPLAEATVWRGQRIEVTGFFCLGARYYDPEGGRFLSADPLGHGESMDLYSYAGGDPINFVDPEGRGKNPGNSYALLMESFKQSDALARQMIETLADANTQRHFSTLRSIYLADAESAYRQAIRAAEILVSAEDRWSSLVGNARMDASRDHQRVELSALANPGRELTWTEQWKYDPTARYEKDLRVSAEVSLALVPFAGGPGRAAGKLASLAMRAETFGIRTDLALGQASLTLGRRGGEIISVSELARIETGLQRQGVTLFKNSDAFLNRFFPDAGAIFVPAREGAFIHVRNDVTRYELFHEISHSTHMRQVGGYDAYTGLTELQKERFVYDYLVRQKWLTEAERTNVRKNLRRYR